jgi:hypothetical protein
MKKNKKKERECVCIQIKKPYTFRRLSVTSYDDDLSLYIHDVKNNNNNIRMNVEYVKIEECDIKIRMFSKQAN